ncbi:hypothetical protein [Nonomuraea sp. NPDC050643]|uniref:hypothetical protein n=1 Tax=Nonomuraea sp. NPDC050643 TaxID=3155660 RepID=UPI003407BAF0
MNAHPRSLSILTAFALLTTGCAGLATAPIAVATSTRTPAPADSAIDDSTPEPTNTPSASDFKISIRILEKACFGSAGCNITYRIKPSYSGPDLTSDQEFTVTYEVRGGEDPQINSFEMTGEEASFASEEFISTSSSASKLRAVVTDVF